MTAFEHLAVLISIVLGLGLTHLLTSVYRLVLARGRVRLYWLPLLWTALLFITQVEWWWAYFGLRGQTTWNFFHFLFILLSPVTLFLAAGFVLPEIEQGRDYDLRAYYYANRSWLFGIVAAGPALDAVRRAMQAGSWTDFGVVSNLVSCVAVASLAVSRRPAYHAAVTLAVAALFLWFIIEAAVQLR